MTTNDIIHIIKNQISKETGLTVDEISNDASFHSLGLDSISAVFVMDQLEKNLRVEMNPMFFWDYPTVEAFSEHIATLLNKS